jgi:hypothetical protein
LTYKRLGNFVTSRVIDRYKSDRVEKKY